MSKYIKNIEKPVQKYRFISQSVFALLCIWIGIEFYFFTSYLESGGTAGFYSRPAGAEGFLPISALMSLYPNLSATSGKKFKRNYLKEN